MDKKKLAISLSVLTLLIIIILRSIFIAFRQSVRYAIFQLTLAQKYQDSQTAL